MRSVVAALLLCSTAAIAHGPAEWIQRGGYKNAAGELCCGPSDCAELSSDEVRAIPGGYLITKTKEFVPNDNATPGEKQSYFLCRWGGQIKCFFFPASGA